MYKAVYLSPMVPSFNIRETVSFFTDLLQFKIARDDSSYVIIYKDNLSVHIMNAGKDIGQMEFYLEVDDVDGLWQDIKDKLSGIKVREPFNQDYGMREMHIAVPATNCLLFVGQELK